MNVAFEGNDDRPIVIGLRGDTVRGAMAALVMEGADFREAPGTIQKLLSPKKCGNTYLVMSMPPSSSSPGPCALPF